MNFYRLIFSFFIFLFSSSAFSAFPPDKSPDSSLTSFVSSQIPICESTFKQPCTPEYFSYPKVIKTSPCQKGEYLCVVIHIGDHKTGGYWSFRQSVPSYSCPENSTLSGSQCVCNAGYEEKNGQCQPVENQCSEGEISSFQIPIGWGVYYPGSSGSIAVDGGGSITPKTVNSPPSSICSGGCNYSFIEQEDNYVNFDHSSGTGAYRIDSFSKYEASGSTCNQESDFSQNSGSPPSCSGTVGTFNGRQYCASNVDPTDPTDPTNPTDPGDGGSTGGDGGSTGGGGGGSTGGDGGSTGGGGGGSTGGDGGSTGGEGEGDGEGGGGSYGGPATHAKWEIPVFYETKYPDGLKSAYNESGLNQASSIFNGLIDSFVPSFGDSGGACQNFQINLNVGIFNFGNIDISPPCIIWPFLWLMVQLTAIFTFRALVFGG